jgi:hypothetical protein
MVEGVVTVAFGKYNDRPLDEVARDDPDYLRWMLSKSFLTDTKAIAYEALERSRGG